MTQTFPYKLLVKHQIIDQINYLAALRIPFLFIIDFKAEHGYVIKQDELDECYVCFQTPSTNYPIQRALNQPISNENEEDSPLAGSAHQLQTWELKPVTGEIYKPKFEFVMEQIHKGNSFLTNLTQPTEVRTNLTLFDLYQVSSAKYKLWLNGMFTVFSPETFVRIEGETISSYPMKGTIDASIVHAEEILMNDLKEKAEHATIVDLIRNDLSLVADQVEVKRYRYIDKIATNKQDLLQVSSEITGRLPGNYRERLGDILFSLLPAGSISGAPKQKTLEIINKAEAYERGFYTGVCGFFDGEHLDSGVMIRFIEQQGDKLIFKSGGGITAQSDMEKEYEELIQKVYVPIHRIHKVARGSI